MSSVSGRFDVSEVLCPFRRLGVINTLAFNQSDLYDAEQPALFLLDTGSKMFLWQGWWPENLEDGDTNNITGETEEKPECVTVVLCRVLLLFTQVLAWFVGTPSAGQRCARPTTTAAWSIPAGLAAASGRRPNWSGPGASRGSSPTCFPSGKRGRRSPSETGR